MADIPLVVTIALGTVPILGAGIAGFVALFNTTSRRVERLKNVTEVHTKLSDYQRTTDRLVVQELEGLQHATDPRCRSLRRAAGGCFVIYLAVFGSTLLPALYGSTLSRWLASIASLGFIFASYVISTKLDRRKLELAVEKDRD